MDEQHPVTVICRYVVKPGKEEPMEQLLRRHWPALHDAGLVTDAPAKVYRAVPSGKSDGEHDAPRTYVEVFEWKDAAAPGAAHQTPAIMAVWEPMGALCEQMEFPHYEPLDS